MSERPVMVSIGDDTVYADCSRCRSRLIVLHAISAGTRRINSATVICTSCGKVDLYNGSTKNAK